MQTYDVYYADRKSSLVLKADLDRGWSTIPGKGGFQANQRIDFRGDCVIRAQLRIYPAPSIVKGKVPEFPCGSRDWGCHLVHYSLRDRVLEVRIALCLEQPWRMMKTGRPGLYIREVPFLDVDATVQFNLESWIVFHSPGIPVRDVKEWGEKMFVSGGQFESSRRRH